MGYPLLLNHVRKDYIWGTELWVLSCHKNGTCTVAEGPEAGRPLDAVLKDWGIEGPFPLLIKLIEAQKDLSVQVHPDDAYAAIHEGQQGKTEAWYVLEAQQGASLIYGFNRALSREEFEAHIRNNTLTEVMHKVPVEKGDLFYIPAGTLHAIGGGLRIAEVQQNSDCTYRVWDYDRRDAEGNPRPLHIEKALDVTETKPAQIPYGKPQSDLLVDCPLFKMKKLCLQGAQPIAADDALCTLLVLEGSLTLTFEGGCLRAEKDQCILLPPHAEGQLSGSAELLLSTAPLK